jgi:hypothetical protein
MDVMANQVDLTIDSGAFSAWKRGEELSCRRYSQFLEEYRGWFGTAINLDVIPRTTGGSHTTRDVEHSAEAGWKNLMRLRKDGHNVMPVYHIGERRYWLEKMIGEGFDYIGLGGLAKRHIESRQKFLDETFGYLCGMRGYPKVKVHGFAMTSLPMMFRYPWYSVDSIRWMLVPSYGRVLIPQLKNTGTPFVGEPPKRVKLGEYDYTVSPIEVAVSGHKSGAQWAVHIDQMGPRNRKHVLTYLEHEGFELDKLRNSHWERMKQVVRMFKRVEEYGVPRKFTGIEHGLIIRDKLKGSRETPAPMKIIFSLCLGWQHSDVLQDEKVRNRLLTYYWFTDKEPIDIRKYVKRGRLPRGKGKKNK